MNAIVPYAKLVDLADAVAPELTDLEVVKAVAEGCDITLGAAIERMRTVDLEAVRKQVTP